MSNLERETMNEEVDADSNDSYSTQKDELVSSCDNAVSSSVSVEGMIGRTRRSSKGGWTEEEDRALAAAVKQYGFRNWKKIAENVAGRTSIQCLHRWKKVLNPDLKKGPWKKDEDDLIRELVSKHGRKKWAEIAKHLPGRMGKQCRERWHNHLNPDINRDKWTKDEEFILIEAHRMYGNRWAEIAKILKGRTENGIKNHWNCSVKKRLEKYGAEAFSFRTESEVGKFKVDEKMESMRSSDSCSLDLSIGGAHSCKSENCRRNSENDRVEAARVMKSSDPSREDSDDSRSVEDILKSAAKSFKNTPSIIRRKM